MLSSVTGTNSTKMTALQPRPERLSMKGADDTSFRFSLVTVTEEARHLAPGEEERASLAREIERLRGQDEYGMMYISFPGDEKSSGGCLAAGRGFFHINSHGGAEPCPFSPYSDVNVRNTSLKDALNSRLFVTLRENGHLLEDHAGGCVLYEKRDLVERILAAESVE